MVLKAKTLYDCSADNDSELSFKKDDIIVDVTETNEEGWLQGRKEGTNIKGLFPSNYVELIEEKEKVPPKIPRKFGRSSDNNIETIDKPSSFEMGSSGSIKDSGIESDIGISIGKPKKLSKNTLAAFESKNHETLPIKPSINPRSKFSSNLVDNSSSNFMKQTNNDKKTVPSSATSMPKSSTSVNSIKSLMENEKNEHSFVPPKKQLKQQEPPLPPRKPSSTPSISSTSSNIENHTENFEKAKIAAQDQSVKVAQQGISNSFSQLKGEFDKSPYGNKKIPGKDRFFKIAEDSVKKEAEVRIKNQIDNTANQQRDSFHNTVKNKNGLISNLEKNFTAATKPSQSPPPLPSRKNLGSNTDSEIKIPRRPPQHSNSFIESNSTKGIPSDAKKRYEIVFDSNKDDDDLISAAVVKEIYIRSRDLLDADEDGNLNRREFCIGMFLIDKRLQGNPVPDKLPKGLLA
ncbi:12328_t:CDS:10 [Entrophospora sp. SA101]|nr:14415_t:CDS:10 [Entrophospora sp. SA101]CAJ0835056.1 9469_t:CDS:10 [Entrophospora sp. SA101]CAJ0837893.1 12328_t:CDS:10 [Entrophospora sp. SA101]